MRAFYLILLFVIWINNKLRVRYVEINVTDESSGFVEVIDFALNHFP